MSVATLQAQMMEQSSQKDELLHDSLDLLGEEINTEVRGFSFDRAASLLSSYIKHKNHIEFANKLFGGRDFGEEVLG